MTTKKGFVVSVDEANACRIAFLMSSVSHRELKAWMLQATRGRYQPPSWKTAKDILITMRVKADNTTKKMMLALRAERVLPSISGMFVCVKFQ